MAGIEVAKADHIKEPEYCKEKCKRTWCPIHCEHLPKRVQWKKANAKG